MKIKKYTANTMKDAMARIREELGADAIILSSKEVRKGGIFGLFEKKHFEVIAAIEKQPIARKTKQEIEPSYMPSNLPPAGSNVEQQAILTELKQMRQILASKPLSMNHYPPLFDDLYSRLHKQYVDPTICTEIVDHVMDRLRNKESMEIDILYGLAKTYIEEKISGKISLQAATDKRIIQFVGPTGVGKTTTLAKVAAMMVMKYKKKVAFITTDTYRIAAIEQLKTYARILSVPVEVAYSMDDYYLALEKFASYDMVFVDTAGRNFRDEKYVEQLKEMLDQDNRSLISYLVLSLTGKNEDIMDIYEQFKRFQVRDIIFTKMDETNSYGPIINLLWEQNVHVSYMTNGQDVPEDVLIPTPKQINELLLSRDPYE